MTPRRTVLILASEFAPLNSVGRFRIQELCRHLPDCGWRCIVLTYAPPRGAQIDPALLDEIPADTVVHRVACPQPIEWPIAVAAQCWHAMHRGRHKPSATVTSSPHRREDLRRRPAALLSSYIDRMKHAAHRMCLIPDDGMPAWPMMKRRAMQIVRREKVNLLFSSVPGFTPWLAAAAVARRARLPLVVDYRDLWHGDVLRQWVGPLRRRIELAMERRALRGTSAVVTVSPSKTPAVRAIDPQPDARRYATIVNGVNANLAADIKPHRSPGDDNALLLVYAGKLYGGRTIEPLVKAIGQLVQSGRVQRQLIRLRVYGTIENQQRARIDNLITQYALADTVVIEGQQPHRVAIACQLGADAVVVVVDPGPTSDGVIPAKLTEAIGLNRFVLAMGAHGDSQQLIDAYGHGTAISPDPSGNLPTPGRIAEALVDMADRKQRDPGAFTCAAASGVLPTRQDVARQFADVFTTAVAARRIPKTDECTPRLATMRLTDHGAPTP